jgi:RNA-directed DNA polymerase
MEDGLVSPVEAGTPQGGPLSPLLSSFLFDDLDKELEWRAVVAERAQSLQGTPP